MSIELQTEKLIKSIGQLAKITSELASATTEMVVLTKALHRAHAIKLQQEFEEAKGEENVRLKNMSMFFLSKQIEALMEATGGSIPGINPNDMPSLVNGADRGY